MVVALTIFGGVLGFDLIMRMQTAITVVTGVLTVSSSSWWRARSTGPTVSALPGGSAEALIGGLVFMMTGFGLGWVNVAADYSRYLPRTVLERRRGRLDDVRRRGGPDRPAHLRAAAGRFLEGAEHERSAPTRSARSPTLLPTWFLIPFVIVAVLGLIGGAVLDIYSSGLALLSLGLRVPRYVAALIDGTVMTLGTIYVVFIAGNFFGQFEGFLITLGRADRGLVRRSCSPTSRCGGTTTPNPSCTARAAATATSGGSRSGWSSSAP